MMQDYLQEGGIDHADVFLAMSSDDHQNLLVAQIAKHIFNVPKVVCHLASLNCRPCMQPWAWTW
jgi:trk system potassium uptake protein TrkA